MATVARISTAQATPGDWEVTFPQEKLNRYKWDRLYATVATSEEWEKAFLDAVAEDRADLADYLFGIAQNRNIALGDLSFLDVEPGDGSEAPMTKILRSSGCRLLGSLLERFKNQKPSINPSSVDARARTYLHRAVESHGLACIQKILKSKTVDINAQDKLKETALEKALAQRNLTVAKLLKDAGAQLSAASQERIVQLVFGRDNPIALQLLYPTRQQIDEARFELPARKQAFTALELAAEMNAAAIAEYLLGIGFEPGPKGNLKPGTGLPENSPFAASFGRWRVFELFARWNPYLLLTYRTENEPRISGALPTWGFKAVHYNEGPGVEIVFNLHPNKKALCVEAAFWPLPADAKDSMADRWRYTYPNPLDPSERTAYAIYKGLSEVCDAGNKNDAAFAAFLKAYEAIQSSSQASGDAVQAVSRFGKDKARTLEWKGQGTFSNTLLDVAVERRDPGLVRALLDAGVPTDPRFYATLPRAVAGKDEVILEELDRRGLLTPDVKVSAAKLQEYVLGAEPALLERIAASLKLKGPLAAIDALGLAASKDRLGTAQALIRQMGAPTDFGALRAALDADASDELCELLWPARSADRAQISAALKVLAQKGRASLFISALSKAPDLETYSALYAASAPYRVDWLPTDARRRYDFFKKSLRAQGLNLRTLQPAAAAGMADDPLFHKAAVDLQLELLAAAPDCETEADRWPSFLLAAADGRASIYSEYARTIAAAYEQARRGTGPRSALSDAIRLRSKENGFVGQSFNCKPQSLLIECLAAESRMTPEEYESQQPILLRSVWEEKDGTVHLAEELRIGTRALGRVDEADADLSQALRKRLTPHSVEASFRRNAAPFLTEGSVKRDFCSLASDFRQTHPSPSPSQGMTP